MKKPVRFFRNTDILNASKIQTDSELTFTKNKVFSKTYLLVILTQKQLQASKFLKLDIYGILGLEFEFPKRQNVGGKEDFMRHYLPRIKVANNFQYDF